jgi:hypothetical protein
VKTAGSSERRMFVAVAAVLTGMDGRDEILTRMSAGLRGGDTAVLLVMYPAPQEGGAHTINQKNGRAMGTSKRKKRMHRLKKDRCE